MGISERRPTPVCLPPMEPLVAVIGGACAPWTNFSLGLTCANSLRNFWQPRPVRCVSVTPQTACSGSSANNAALDNKPLGLAVPKTGPGFNASPTRKKQAMRSHRNNIIHAAGCGLGRGSLDLELWFIGGSGQLVGLSFVESKADPHRHSLVVRVNKASMCCNCSWSLWSKCDCN